MTDQTSSSRDTVLSIGRIYCDLVFTGLDRMPAQGSEVFASNLTPTLGGGAFIVAGQCAALGRHAALVSRYGTDPLSLALEDQFSRADIDLAYLERAADAGPQVTVVMVEGTERAFLSRRAGSAEPCTLSTALADRRTAHLHIAEYATLFEIPNLVTRAKMTELSVSLDPSWDDTLIGALDLVQACKGVDLFLPNLAEGRAIAGLQAPEDVLAALAPYFPVVALKLGPAGGMLAHDGKVYSAPAEDVPVVDTTGAGDAFDAGLIDAWLSGRAPDDCLHAAIAAASRSIQSVGGIPVSAAQHKQAI